MPFARFIAGTKRSPEEWEAIVSSKPVQISDLEEYTHRIHCATERLIEEGSILFGRVSAALDIPRRGWIIRGIPHPIAETIKEHSDELRDCGEAYMIGHQGEIVSGLFHEKIQTHDTLESIHIDVTPSDTITADQKKNLELAAITEFYSHVHPYGLTRISLYHSMLMQLGRDDVVLHYLDKEHPHVKAREIQNNFELLHTFYAENEQWIPWLHAKYKTTSLDEALNKVYKRLDEFYTANQQKFKDPFFKEVVEEIQAYKKPDVYNHFLNLLSKQKV